MECPKTEPEFCTRLPPPTGILSNDYLCLLSAPCDKEKAKSHRQVVWPDNVRNNRFTLRPTTQVKKAVTQSLPSPLHVSSKQSRWRTGLSVRLREG